MTFFVWVVELRDTGTRVAVFLVVIALRGFKIDTFRAVRGETFVLTALRDVVERAVFSVVTTVLLFPRVAVFSPREAAPAPDAQNTKVRIK